MDVLGNVVFQSTINNRQSTIDLGGFAKGIYFVEIIAKDTPTQRKKIVLQ